MTDRHDPQLVDTIARALYNNEKSLADSPAGWDEFDDLPDPWREEWYDLAIAALDALPKPLGYAVAVEHLGKFYIGPDDITSDRAAVLAEATEWNAAGGSNATPVALVPVEQP